MSVFTNLIRRLFRSDASGKKEHPSLYGPGLEAFERRRTIYYGRGVAGFGLAPQAPRKRSDT